jgi:hypothetical protein
MNVTSGPASTPASRERRRPAPARRESPPSTSAEREGLPSTSAEREHRPSASASRGRRLSPAARKTTLILHLIASMAWLTLMICVFVLAVVALTTPDADTLRTAYRAMPLLGDALILPLSVLSLGSGLLLALGTRWRLFRFHWVAVKFWLTLAATFASNLALTARLHEAAHAATRHPTGSIAEMDLGFLPYNLLIISCAAIALYTVNVVLSVVKPWGVRARYKGGRDRRRPPDAPPDK